MNEHCQRWVECYQALMFRMIQKEYLGEWRFEVLRHGDWHEVILTLILDPIRFLFFEVVSFVCEDERYHRGHIEIVGRSVTNYRFDNHAYRSREDALELHNRIVWRLMNPNTIATQLLLEEIRG